MVMGRVFYDEMTDLLQDPAYWIISKDPTKNTEQRVGLLLKKSGQSGNVQLLKPYVFRPPDYMVSSK